MALEAILCSSLFAHCKKGGGEGGVACREYTGGFTVCSGCPTKAKMWGEREGPGEPSAEGRGRELRLLVDPDAMFEYCDRVDGSGGRFLQLVV